MKNKLPQIKNDNFLEQSLEKELLIYDLNINKAFCLNETAAKVYHACDGTKDIQTMSAELSLPAEVIKLALDDFDRRNLLVDSFEINTSRRELIRKAGFASVFALPVISALVAPKAIYASSNCVAPGNDIEVRNNPALGAAVCYQPEIQSQCCDGTVNAVEYGDPDFTFCTC